MPKKALLLVNRHARKGQSFGLAVEKLKKASENSRPVQGAGTGRINI